MKLPCNIMFCYEYSKWHVLPGGLKRAFCAKHWISWQEWWAKYGKGIIRKAMDCAYESHFEEFSDKSLQVKSNVL